MEGGYNLWEDDDHVKRYECSNGGSTAHRQDVRHIYGVTRLDNLATAKITNSFFFYHLCTEIHMVM
jgi:hypothetical protein